MAVLSHHHLRQAAYPPNWRDLPQQPNHNPTTKVNKSVHLAPTRRTILAAGILSVAMIFAAPTSEAVSITWGAAQTITGDSDVRTSGTLVGAINIGAPGVANTTVNGVLFTGLALSGNNVTSGDFNLATAGGFGASNGLGSGSPPFSALSAPYQTLLASAATSFTAGLTLTMSGLVVGERYEFQWWSNASGGTASVLTIATAGNSVTLATSLSGGQGQVGQFALGTFIADNAAQVVTFDGPVQDILNGFQLRQLGPVDAIWLGNVSSDWNTGTNWIGGNAPVIPNDTATFNTSTNTSPTLSANVTIDSITFNPGASAFTIQTSGNVLTLQGVGIVNNSGSVQTIINNNFTSDGVSFVGQTVFTNSASAGATVIINSDTGTSTQFFGNSTAGNATTINSGAGSFTAFTQGASGGNAALINANPTAFITIAELNGAGTTAGSIAGNGTIFLGSKNLTVGGNQQSTVFSGVIADGEFSGLPPALLTAQPSYSGGSLTKVGTGTLTLTGINTYTGGTNLDGGILAVNSDLNLGTGPLSFNGGTLEALAAGGGITSFKAVNLATGGGTFLADAGTTSTLSGLITGVGAWAKTGPGTLALSGANTYSGGTTIAGGTILTQNASALGTGPVAFGNGAALQVQNLLNVNGNWTVSPGSATVSGGTVQTFGDFNLGGGGTLIVNANFNVPGAANINSSGFVVNSAFTANDDIDLNGSAAAVVNGLLTSPSVNVNNSSSLVVNVPGTVAANVNVGPSALLGLFGRINGSVVNAGFFQGTGVVNGNVVNSGIVSPGASIGTLTINGNYTQNPSGTLRIEVAGASAGQYDVLVVNGRANIAGRLQLVRVGNFTLQVGDQITFLTASGGVSGTFGNVENDFLATGSVDGLRRHLPVECRRSRRPSRAPLRNSPASSVARPMRSRWGRRSTARSAILGHRS